MPLSTDDPGLTRGHKKKERTRQQLVAAAIDVIAAKGEAFTVSDVANRAGVANGTFYNYFTDRDAVIDAVAPEVLTAFANEGASAVSHDDPAVSFATISALALTRATTNPDAMRVILRLDAVQQAIIDGDVVLHLRRDLEAGAAAGRFTFGSSSAAIDVVVGSLLLATRRIVAGEPAADYTGSVVVQLLCSLGLDRSEATAIADQAITAAARLDSQS